MKPYGKNKNHTLQARINDKHKDRFNQLKKDYNKTSDTAMIEHMIELTPLNSEAELIINKIKEEV